MIGMFGGPPPRPEPVEIDPKISIECDDNEILEIKSLNDELLYMVMKDKDEGLLYTQEGYLTRLNVDGEGKNEDFGSEFFEKLKSLKMSISHFILTFRDSR